MRQYLTRDADGHLLVLSIGLAVPRQNGKNGTIEGIEFYLMVTDPNTHILHTAHSSKTAQKAFERMCKNFTKPFQKNEEILDMVEKKNGGRIRYANGEQGIYLSNGASIEYATRTNAGGRGFDSITLLVYDEAQELTQTQIDALDAVVAASKGDQLKIYTGTPPNENAAGTVFESLRKACLDGEAGDHTCWHEWSIETLPPSNAKWEDILPLAYATNPALEVDRPGHLREAEIQDSFNKKKMDDIEGFCRERLGYWSEGTIFNPALDIKTWQSMRIDNPPTSNRVKRTMGIKFSPDGQHVAVVNAIKQGKNKPHVELAEYTNISHAGVRPLAEALMKLRNKVSYIYIDGASGAQTLADDLKARGYPTAGYGLCNTADIVAASSSLVNWVRSKAFTHYGQEALDESVASATKRTIGKKDSGGFGFGGEAPEPVEATALALLAMKRTRRNPNPKQKIKIQR